MDRHDLVDKSNILKVAVIVNEYNLYSVLENIRNDVKISEQLFEQMLNDYELTISDFESGQANQIEFSELMIDKLFRKENKNFHTISSKENFSNLTKEGSDVPFLVYHPLNDHSRSFLGIGDILFSYRTGQFGDLEEALNTRGIYGLGIAISNPMEFDNQHQGRDAYKNYGVIIFYPFKLKEHLSVRDIQLNPHTINLTPYNGNRNDSLQHIPKKEHYNTLLGMILSKNTHIKEFLEFMNLHIEESIIPDDLWNQFERIDLENSNDDKFDYKAKFKKWLEEEGKVKPKTQSNYISAINGIEKIWNENHEGKIDIWENPYFIKDDIGKERLFSDPHVKQLNGSQNQTHSSAINYYFEFLDILESIKGINRIYFGAPGTGKSYNIEQFIKENGIADYSDKVDCPNVYRATLHPEFTYTDFVGQVMPVVTPINEDGSNTKIEYKFSPQVFTNALKYAFKFQGEPVFLILEEMSRANVAAVFGDLFQLLDRDEKGESEYRIDNLIISKEIWGEKSTRKIYLPHNLFIIGTVNTNDQNVFVMDTAFKRRFEFEYVDANEIAKDKAGVPLNNFTFKFSNGEGAKELEFDWIVLYTTLNRFITSNGETGLGLSEDKQLGQFFIKFRKNDEEYNYNQFKGKLLEYLWNDVQKVSYSNVSIFKQELSNFSMAHRKLKNKENIFSQELLEQLNQSKA